MKLIFSGLAIIAAGCMGMLANAHETLEAAPKRFVNQEIYQTIKNLKTTWTAVEPSKNPFKNKSDKEISRMFGLKSPLQGSIASKLFRQYKSTEKQSKILKDPILGGSIVDQSDPKYHRLNQSLPQSFDARNQWPACIHPVRDQGSCGSCWAFASSAFLEDRFCIASAGAISVTLSPQDMVTCDLSNGGCDGGWLALSLNYLITEGLVTEQCMAYSGEVGFCTYQCNDPYTVYRKYGCKLDSTKILTTVDEIKLELMTNGPMMVGFTIYTDFISYSSGIYKQETGVVEGGHAVKLIGWDYDGNNNLFWICQNQWDTTWGEQGFFKIYAGQVGIDSAVFSCDPDLS